MSHKHLQRLFLGFMLSFLLFLVSSVILRSRERTSLLGAAFSAQVSKEEELALLKSPVKNNAALHLQEFHRIEVQDGRPIWEVTARDAKYYALEGVAHVSDAEVIVYRTKGRVVRFHCNAGKLYLSENIMERAEMEGDVVVKFDNAIVMKTEMALYDVNTNVITSPEFVDINGPSYSVKGRGLRVDVQSQVINLYEDVESSFASGEQVPNSTFDRTLIFDDK